MLSLSHQTGVQKPKHPVSLAPWVSRGGSPWFCVRPKFGGSGDRLLPSQRTATVVGGREKEAFKRHTLHTGKNSLSVDL